MEANPPRRLAVGFLENNVVGGSVNGEWWPPVWPVSNVDATGPREWLWIFDADYAETPDPAFEGNAIWDPMPIMYFLTFSQRDGTGFATGDEFLIKRSIANTDAD